MKLGMWLVLLGGTLELAAVVVATVAVVLAYRGARSRIDLLRASLAHYTSQVSSGVDSRAAAAEKEAFRRKHGIPKPDLSNDDLSYIKDHITYLISRSAARSALLTVAVLASGIVLTTLGSLLNSAS